MNNVINRMEEISNIWEQIYKASEKYFDNNTTCESYKQMSNLFETWSKILKEQYYIVNIDIREHFKFIRKNFGSMKELANSIDSHKYNYQKSVKSLLSKKEDLFNIKNFKEKKRKALIYNIIKYINIKSLKKVILLNGRWSQKIN